MDNKKLNNNKRGMNNKKTFFYILIAAIVTLALFTFMTNQLKAGSNIEISYDKFINMLDKGEVKSVLIQSDKIVIEPVTQPNQLYKISYYTGVINDDKLADRLLNAKDKDGNQVTIKPEIVDTRTTLMDIIVVWILPFVLIYLVMWFLFKMISKNGGGMMGGVGKSNAKVYVEKQTGVTFKDVAGQEEAKESLTELVDFLHNPGKYTRIGAKLPKGALLVGPPGTGKTLLAKAVAGEANVPFFSLSGSDFVEMFVGVGASRVRDLFKQAQSMAPCIIFIDEVDAIGKSRDSHYGGGNDEREQTLNQLLSEMDGFDTSKGLVILAATNRPEVLDKALLRPGRFDRRVIVDKPDLKGRIDILKVHAKDVLMHDSVDLEAIGLATSGAVGSDLANMINEAAILAVKKGRTVVTQEDLFESVEVVVAGKEKKDRILNKEEKQIVAYHEVGHALVTALEKKAEPVQKITIVPRTMGSLGYVMQVPEEEKYLMSKDELIARIVTLYGGRAAEQLIFNSITTGASNDIEKATQLARAMVTQYGMSDKFGLMGLESIENRYLDGRAVLNCGDATAAEIDKEVMAILKECYSKAESLLADNREVLDKIAAFLVEKETITGKEFMDIFREVKGLPAEDDLDGEKPVIEDKEIPSQPVI
ncbi:ATP-dependent zinc metalloprotease FtsH [Anaerocolumna sedimenticola]|uniref:ATP-dependent zinc metalloprotease FtsH n=1 Tax=Anaerocolumna sedimenticola TaxID=2696063 RepID=A0A6P1TM11_9FIRM|nr:ATP-dependent zinc metalloprotease FtsH [Anaerocolumna sedimenticola]QHQ60715.1 ATP-dependent zinc metalloprotease FtsH [Anaerocolumna sedimenticola]